MKRIHEPDDSSISSKDDHMRSEDLSEEHTGTEIATTEQESMQNLNQSDNQNLSMQPGTSSQTDNIHRCDQGAFSTSQKNNLKRHRKTSGDIFNFQCSVCVGKFRLQKTLIMHYNQIHNQFTDGIYRCDQCLYTTKRHPCLIAHKKTHVNISDF